MCGIVLPTDCTVFYWVHCKGGPCVDVCSRTDSEHLNLSVYWILNWKGRKLGRELGKWISDLRLLDRGVKSGWQRKLLPWKRSRGAHWKKAHRKQAPRKQALTWKLACWKRNFLRQRFKHNGRCFRATQIAFEWEGWLIFASALKIYLTQTSKSIQSGWPSTLHHCLRIRIRWGNFA